MTNPKFEPMDPRKWAVSVATLCSPAFPAEATTSLIGMLPFLDDFPPSTFCRESLEAVACAKRRQSVPALDEIRAALNEWQRSQTPINRAPWQPQAALASSRPRLVGDVLGDQRTPEEIEAREAEKAHVADAAAAIAAELRAQEMARRSVRAPMQASYLPKLVLAKQATPAVLASRPDLQAALAMAAPFPEQERDFTEKAQA